MQAFGEQLESLGLAVVEDADGADDCPVADDDTLAAGDGFVLDVLAAVADMSLRSKRRQADLDAAMRCAGLEAGYARRLGALERLRQHGFIDKVVELNDGGVLLSVTALGLDRLGGARRHCPIGTGISKK